MGSSMLSQGVSRYYIIADHRTGLPFPDLFIHAMCHYAGVRRLLEFLEMSGQVVGV